jgi:hypothetical protein
MDGGISGAQLREQVQALEARVSALEKPRSLLEKVAHPWDFAARKHGMGEGYAEREINAMSQYEFLKEISEALEEMHK